MSIINNINEDLISKDLVVVESTNENLMMAATAVKLILSAIKRLNIEIVDSQLVPDSNLFEVIVRSDSGLFRRALNVITGLYGFSGISVRKGRMVLTFEVS